jgi:integrase
MSKRPNGTGNIYRRGPVWWIRFSRNGKQYAESSKSEERKDAERMLATRLGDIATGRFQGLTAERLTVWNLCELVVADYEFHNKRGLEDLRWRAEKHLRKPFEQLLALALTSERLRSYKKERRVDGAADATINRELAVIRRGFTLAREAGLYRGEAPHFGLFKLDNARQGFVEEADYRKLLAALPPHLRCLAIAGYHLGMRAGELRKLQWPQVDLDAREIRLAAAQTKGKRAPHRTDLRRSHPGIDASESRTRRQVARCAMGLSLVRQANRTQPERVAPICKGSRSSGPSIPRPPPLRNPEHGTGWNSSKDRHVDQRTPNRIGLSSIRHREPEGSRHRQRKTGGLPHRTEGN